MKSKNRIKASLSERIFYGIVAAVVALFGICVLYPVIYIISSSFSSPKAVMSGNVLLLPVDFTLNGYGAVLRYDNVWVGFRNSLFYMTVGTTINLVMTTLAAYPLSRKDVPFKGIIMFLFTFTMIFNAGMIPNYLLIRDLGILNTVWAMLIPGAVSVYNMIVMRTFFMTSIPEDLLEASKLDGCTDFQYLRKVVLPLSKSILAVIVMYYAVGHWNAYFNAFLYLSDDRRYPLQLFLRDILISNQVGAEMVDTYSENVGIEYVLKYALIVIATVPMVVIYPFVQKHFQKGVMIGAIKG
ncbi:MAG TPA: carbohydrate ABC transporter permease [Candidatus Eisenbergiella merdavium]|uniref:Carbohydrate ABC transporter permease n=1 Tax=Candidatus Eisenbergiella merdavium TaxID=2838551 RepID=A0A9D2SMU0_9FIRM|nr:carbohydrate ABC transporter permease [Candidatus Eisenbergiella merdavium]